MKLSFSTLGCPNWTFSEILSTAKDLGYDGIELRGLGEDIFLPDCSHFKQQNLAASKSQLDAIGLEISCISTDCRLHEQADCTADAIAYIKLAEGLGCKYIRLLGDTTPEPRGEIDLGLVAKRLKLLAPEAAIAGVTLLVETNGRLADTALLRTLIEGVGSSAVGVLWDLNHPCRFYGETPDMTYNNIGKYVRHIHVKDSKTENGKPVYKMFGYGDLPLTEAFTLLKASGYAGYISLEWTKRWNAELEDAGIVFSHFAYAARRLWSK